MVSRCRYVWATPRSIAGRDVYLPRPLATTTDLEREHAVDVDQLMAVRHLGADVREREELVDQLADGLDHGPADPPPDRQQPDAGLRGQARSHRGPVHVAAVLGEREPDRDERAEGGHRQQPVPVVHRVEVHEHGERREIRAQRDGPVNNK